MVDGSRTCPLIVKAQRTTKAQLLTVRWSAGLGDYSAYSMTANLAKLRRTGIVVDEP